MIAQDSTICEVHGKHKQCPGCGYTGVLGYHLLLAALAGTDEILFAGMRHGSANTAQCAVQFVDELVAVCQTRWIDRACHNARSLRVLGLETDRPAQPPHKICWSITARLDEPIKQAIAAIADHA